MSTLNYFFQKQLKVSTILLSCLFISYIGCTSQNSEENEEKEDDDYVVSWLTDDSSWELLETEVHNDEPEILEEMSLKLPQAVEKILDKQGDNPLSNFNFLTQGHDFGAKVVRYIRQWGYRFANRAYDAYRISISPAFTWQSELQSAYSPNPSTLPTIFEYGDFSLGENKLNYIEGMKRLVGEANVEYSLDYLRTKNDISKGWRVFYYFGDYKYQQSQVTGFTDFFLLKSPTNSSLETFLNDPNNFIPAINNNTIPRENTNGTFSSGTTFVRNSPKGDWRINWHRNGKRMRLHWDFPRCTKPNGVSQNSGTYDFTYYYETSKKYQSLGIKCTFPPNPSHNLFVEQDYDFKFLMREITNAPKEWKGLFIKAVIDSFYQVSEASEPRIVMNAFFSNSGDYGAYINFRRLGIYIRTNANGDVLYATKNQKDLSAEDKENFQTLHQIINNRNEFNDSRLPSF